MQIEFYKHNIDEKDIEEVTKVLKSVFLTTGPVTLQFEKKFSDYVHLAHTVTLNSCTAALHLALLALDIGPGDEVITTPMTFIATANSILHVGATPIFVDVEKSTGLIDVNKIEKAITAKTKAIMPIHLYGTMVDMVALNKIAKKHNLKVIEDCAHCIEGERDGIRPGQLSDVACYSFYATKNLACGEGGAASTNDEALAKKIRLLRQHGMSKEAAGRYHGQYEHWDMVELGWKYNLNDILSALLINQIDKLDSLLEKRKALYSLYLENLNGVKNLEILETKGKSALHLFTVLVPADKRDLVIKKLQNEKIGVAVNYRSVHTLTFYKTKYNFAPLDFPVSNDIGLRTVTLPLYPKMSKDEVLYVCNTLKSILSGMDK